MRTLLSLITVFVVTMTLAPVVVVAALLGVRERPGSIYERAIRWWTTAMNRAAGMRIRVHGAEHIRDGAVYVSNHVSWYDVFAVAQILPRSTWVAKSELRAIPIFGRGAEAVGIIFLERDNRRSAFASYDSAAAEVRRGRNVVVCPEGTRGEDYTLRPFKKGPFVLAIAAGAPIVPTVVHGAREVMRKGSFRITAHTVDVHFLDPVFATGASYDDRDRLVAETRERMAALLEREYGVSRPPDLPQPGGGVPRPLPQNAS